MTQTTFSAAAIRAFAEAVLPSPAPPAPARRRLSVVVPSYNQAAFIGRTLNTIVNQHYPNLDLIVLDGGSGDGSQAVIERYRPYIRHYESGPDGGQAMAINRGFAMADGDFLAWQNSDDLYLPGFFSAIDDLVESHPDVDMIIANSYVIDEHEEILWPTRYGPFSLDHLIRVGWNMTSQSVFLRRDLVQGIGPLPDYPVAFDWEWFIRAARAARCIVVMKRYGGCYRVHAASKLTTTQAQRREDIEKSILAKLGVACDAERPIAQQWPLRVRWLSFKSRLNQALLYPRSRLLSPLTRLWLYLLRSRGVHLVGFEP